MKTRKELGKDLAKIVINLKKENEDIRIKNYGQLIHCFVTDNVLNGIYPMPQVYANLEKYAKKEETKEAISTFVMNMAETGLTGTSFYRTVCKAYPEPEWVGEEFHDAYVDNLICYSMRAR